MPKLKSMKIGHYEYLYNLDVGYFPYFIYTIKQRVRKRLANNTIISGEARIGKTYQSNDIARVVDRRYDIDDCVFRYSEFMRASVYEKLGIPLTFDEPSYAIGKREWYKEVNQALVKTIESFGFKVHPLFIPIINKSLLDKTVRNHLIQYQINMIDRGYGKVYRIYPSQMKDKVYYFNFCTLKYSLFDNNLCNIESCLGCDKLDPKKTGKRCMIFRGQYERKKSKTQNQRYEEAIEKADSTESSNLSLEEVEAKALQFFDQFYNSDKDKIDVEKMGIILWRKLKIKLGHNKMFRLAKALRYDHPKLFVNATNVESKDVETKGSQYSDDL